MSTYTYLATESTARDMSRAFMRFQYKQPRTIVIYIALLLFLLFESVANGSGDIVAMFLIEVVVFALVLTVVMTISARRITKRFKALVAVPGATLKSAFGDTAFHLELPNMTGDVSYNNYTKIGFQSNFVFLRQSNSRVYTILPKELVPETERYHFRTAK